jgi:zinc D-Ala-D-Ala carboxypeptidase
MLDGIRATQARIAHIQSHFSTPSISRPRAGGTSAPAFAAALSSATATSAAGLVPAARKAGGGYGPMQVPAELRRYGNGRIPEHALVAVGVGEHRLSRDAAKAFARMRADAAAAGVNVDVSDSYRSFDEQVDLARRKGLYSQGGLAAAPGTSNHGWGLAVDVDVNDRGYAWMAENAWRYGFAEDTPREPWHWGYRPASPAH